MLTIEALTGLPRLSSLAVMKKTHWTYLYSSVVHLLVGTTATTSPVVDNDDKDE